MKKFFALVFSIVLSTALFAQVMGSSGIKNTVSTSFGQNYGKVNDKYRSGIYYHGLIDTFQVRHDVGKFTVEGMLNWGLINQWDNANDNWYVSFENTERTPYWYTNHFDQGGWWTNGNTESYYVNFLFSPVKGLDIGAGTRLNWKVGPAPAHGANFWEPGVHIVQGGLKDADPGHADVVGYSYYANKYSSYYAGKTNAALGIRYKYNDLFEIGLSLPSGASTKTFVFNAGFGIHPVDFLSAFISYDGICSSIGNLYIGSSLYFKNITVDLYVAGNFRPANKDINGNRISNDKVGVGGTVTFSIPQINMTIKPEVGFTDYMNPNYTFAWYTGGRLDVTLADVFTFGTWIAFAGGAADNRWYNDKLPTYGVTKNYDGGFIFNIHPDILWQINKRHSLSVFYDYQNRKKYNDENYDVWATGLSYTYQY